MKRIMVYGLAAMCLVVSTSYADLPTDQDLVDGAKKIIQSVPETFDRIIGTETKEERNAYKSALKEVKEIERQEKKQEKITHKACTTNLVKTGSEILKDPVKSVKEIANGRMVGATKCDIETENLDDTKAKKTAAQREAAIKKIEYEAAREETNSWR